MATTPSTAQQREGQVEFIGAGTSEKRASNEDGYTCLLGQIQQTVEVTGEGILRFRCNVWLVNEEPTDTLLPNSKVGDIAFRNTILTTTSKNQYTASAIYHKVAAADWNAITSS